MEIYKYLVIINTIIGAIFLIVNLKDLFNSIKLIIRNKKFKSIGSLLVVILSYIILTQQFFQQLFLNLRLIYFILSLFLFLLLSFWTYKIFKYRIKEPFYNAYVKGILFDDLLINIMIIVLATPAYISYKDKLPLDIEFRVISHNPNYFLENTCQTNMKILYEIILVNNTGNNIDASVRAIHSTVDYRLINPIIDTSKDPISDYLNQCVYYYANTAFIPLNSAAKFIVLDAFAEIPNLYDCPIDTKFVDLNFLDENFTKCKIPSQEKTRPPFIDFKPFKIGKFLVTNEFFISFNFYWRALITVIINNNETRHYIFRGIISHPPLVLKSDSEQILCTGNLSEIVFSNPEYYTFGNQDIPNKENTIEEVNINKQYSKTIWEPISRKVINEFRINPMSIGQMSTKITDKEMIKTNMDIGMLVFNHNDTSFYDRQVKIYNNCNN